MAKYVSLSCTDNNLYSFFLPIVTWSWKQLGYESIVFVPDKWSPQFRLALEHCPESTRFVKLDIAEDREVTYFQCARLYASALDFIEDSDTIITSDVDMVVFSKYFEQFSDGKLHIAGHDICPPNQYPICYIGMPAKAWRTVFHIREKDTPYTMLHKLLGQIQCENMRGNYWAKDQETAYNCISLFASTAIFHDRSYAHHPTASNRADRDGWMDYFDGMIDAHLPRPGHIEENWIKVRRLLLQAYPHLDTGPLDEYREQFCKLTNG